MAETARKKLNEQGIEGAMSISYGKDTMIIYFRNNNLPISKE
jgi:hypothetical protein